MSLRKAVEGKLESSEREQLIERGLTPFLFEIEFWAQADEVGEHYLWLGPIDRRGRPVHITGRRRQRFQAALVAWTRCRESYPPGEIVGPTCGEKLCIRPGHQEVRSAP